VRSRYLRPAPGCAVGPLVFPPRLIFCLFRVFFPPVLGSRPSVFPPASFGVPSVLRPPQWVDHTCPIFCPPSKTAPFFVLLIYPCSGNGTVPQSRMFLKDHFFSLLLLFPPFFPVLCAAFASLPNNFSLAPPTGRISSFPLYRFFFCEMFPPGVPPLDLEYLLNFWPFSPHSPPSHTRWKGQDQSTQNTFPNDSPGRRRFLRSPNSLPCHQTVLCYHKGLVLFARFFKTRCFFSFSAHLLGGSCQALQYHLFFFFAASFFFGLADLL